jgi:hypothetical protein
MFQLISVYVKRLQLFYEIGVDLSTYGDDIKPVSVATPNKKNLLKL